MLFTGMAGSVLQGRGGRVRMHPNPSDMIGVKVWNRHHTPGFRVVGLMYRRTFSSEFVIH